MAGTSGTSSPFRNKIYLGKYKPTQIRSLYDSKEEALLDRIKKGGADGLLAEQEWQRYQKSKNRKLAEWLYNIEAPYKDADLITDNDGNIIALKPQNVQDGYITIGAGHIIQTEADARKYGFYGLPGMKWDGSLTDDEIARLIKEQQAKYGTGTSNPAILTVSQAKELLADDLVVARKTAESYAQETGKTYTSNEMDALTSMIFNGTKPNDPDSLSYYLLRQDKEGALNIIRKAVQEGWYGEHGGLLRRRLMEYNIFFNNDYTYYDDTRLDELKEKVGY